MRIGLTLFVPPDGLALWSNGGGQNVCALWLLLRAAGHDVILINGGPGAPPAPESLPTSVRPMQFARPGDVVDTLDILIEAGAQVSAEHVATVHARGGRAVTLKYGNALAIDAERAVHDLPAGAIFNGARFDEVWTTAQHAAMCGPYWETTYRAPVRVLPHVWTPDFVDAVATDLERAGHVARYQPGRARKRIIIAEPNINLVKTAHIPMLIVERAWRERPELIEWALVANAQHMRTRLPFSTFANALDIVHAKGADGLPVMSFEGRWSLPYTMATRGDVLVSHQWIPSGNYLLYDAMRLGFPIVHNVLGVPGYLYDGFDCVEGGRALVDALTMHDDAGATPYAAGCAAYLAIVDALAPVNVEAHARAVEEVFRGR